MPLPYNKPTTLTLHSAQSGPFKNVVLATKVFRRLFFWSRWRTGSGLSRRSSRPGNKMGAKANIAVQRNAAVDVLDVRVQALVFMHRPAHRSFVWSALMWSYA
jgi:hypothetical protein